MRTNQNKKQKEYDLKIDTSADLLRKELDINLAEQALLSQRQILMKSQMNAIPDFDPQYIVLLTQLDMDRIEWDELKIRASKIVETLEKLRE